MRIASLTILILLFFSFLSSGQPLTGVKTIPGSYSSIQNAIADLNQKGVGTGGVIFNVSAGYTESFLANNSGLITATGTQANPVVFRRSGTGANPVITGTGSAGGNYDYVIAFQGSDFITFDGIDVMAYDMNQEWGYALLKASPTNGCQNVTIKNCTITLSMYNLNSVGIYVANVTPGNPASQLVLTAASGTNSSNHFYNNFISNVYFGIKLDGYNDPNAPYSFYDRNNDIGSEGGNTIQDFGGDNNSFAGIFTRYQNLIQVRNNTVSGFVQGTGDCSGIQVSTANNASTDISGNTISLQYYGYGVFYGINSNTGSMNTGNVVNLNNNTVTGCIYPFAINLSCYYIYNRSYGQVLNVYGNSVNNNVYGSVDGTATGTVYGISITGPQPTIQGEVNIYDNEVVDNSRKQTSLAGGMTYYFQIGAQGNTLNVYGNTVNNDTVRATGQTFGMEILSQSNIKNIYDNKVTNIFKAYGVLYGIYTGNGSACNIYRNRVQNLHSDMVSSNTSLTGIYTGGIGSTGNMYLYNNVVGELYTPNAYLVGNPGNLSITGIYLGNTNVQFLGFYNNTVYLNASSTGQDFSTAGIYLGAYAKSFDCRNNIIINKSEPMGNGVTMAFKASEGTYKAIASTSNNNNYFAGPPTPNRVIYWDNSTYDQTLQDFQMRVWPKESRSITELTTFVNVSVSPYDLHVKTTAPNQVESGGTVISSPVNINTDFELQPRFPNAGYPDNPLYPATAPDMGADEFAGMPGDNTPPTILFDPLLKTSETGNRLLTANITDVHGLPHSGIGAPKIYWKKGFNGAWNNATGAYIANDNFSFSFGGGVIEGDTVFYYVAAQDEWASPNVGSYPFYNATGFSANPPACSYPPPLPLWYRISGSMCGTYNVGVGQIYPTLTAAVADLNQKHLTCPVTLLLTDDFYPSETYPIVIGQIAGASAVNTITIKPAPGKTPYFQGSYTALTIPRMALISLVGTKYLTIDGSNSGGTDRSLRIQNLGLDGWAAAIAFYSTDQTGASDITIKNCLIQAHEDLVLSAQGISSYLLEGQPGFRNITIQNNEINSCKTGISLYGNLSNRPQNVRITGNKIGSTTKGQYVTYFGLAISVVDSLLIEGNEVIGPVEGVAPSTSLMGIKLQYGLTNLKVQRNIVHDWYHTATDAVGIYLDTPDSYTESEVSNNLIYDIKGPGSNLLMSGANPAGIWMFSGRNYKFYHNTIVMRGSVLASAYATMTTCIGFYGNGTSNVITGIDMQNNIFRNSMTNAAGPAGSKTYAVVTNSPGCFTTVNNNDYYADGAGPNIGYLSVDRPTLSDWQTATGQDANSLNLNPSFVSTSNFHPTNVLLNNKGVYLSAVPRDLDNHLRNDPSDMGCYEFGADPVVVTLAAAPLGGTTATLNGTVNAFNEFVVPSFDYGTTTAYGTTLSATPSPIIGNLTNSISLSATSLTPNTTYHFRAKGVASSGLIIYGEDMTFTTTALVVPENTTVTGTTGEGADTCFNALNTITVGGAQTYTVQSGAHVNMIAGQKIVFLPGTSVVPGGYLHGWISTGTWCQADNPVVAALKSGQTGSEGTIVAGNSPEFILFPNPTSGSFNLMLKSGIIPQELNVEVFNIQGSSVLKEKRTGITVNTFDLNNLPSGIYFVKIITGVEVATLKVVKR